MAVNRAVSSHLGPGGVVWVGVPDSAIMRQGRRNSKTNDAQTGIPSNRSPSSPALFRLTIPSSHFKMRRSSPRKLTSIPRTLGRSESTP